ncbi:MAG TPA: glycosyltransferase [Chloroflexota bacterium]|nr:glycosyltransferase [Chloroflexota bacterium]
MHSGNARAPALSVVIVTVDRYETIRRTIKHLRAQTARDALEILIVAPSAATLGPVESELDEFREVQVIEVGTVESAGQARAAAVRRATAPVIAFVEDHSFPDPGWAAALIEAHQQPWAAVGPAIGNANPGSMISWADLLIDYGRWVEPGAGGEIDDVPGHNSSYKRALLLEYGPSLDAMLERESVMHQDLRARGHRLYLEPAAKTHHLNVSRLSSSMSLRFNFGRLFAADRARNEGWSAARRLLYVAGAPLIPFVHLRRILQETPLLGRRRDLLAGVLPALVLGLAVHGLGEMVGYGLGVGNAAERMYDIEFHRLRHLTKLDAQAAGQF